MPSNPPTPSPTVSIRVSYMYIHIYLYNLPFFTNFSSKPTSPLL